MRISLGLALFGAGIVIVLGSVAAAGWAVLAAGFILLVSASPRPTKATQWFWRHRPAPATTALLWTKHAGSLTSVSEASYLTEGNPSRAIVVEGSQGRTDRVVFVRPVSLTVRRELLPMTVRGRRGNMRVTHFVPGGFVVDEDLAVGDSVLVEIDFDDR